MKLIIIFKQSSSGLSHQLLESVNLLISECIIFSESTHRPDQTNQIREEMLNLHRPVTLSLC